MSIRIISILIGVVLLAGLGTAALLLSIELANYVTQDNLELAGFISSQLLAHSADYF